MKKFFFQKFEEVREVVITLKIKNSKEYFKKKYLDPRLPPLTLLPQMFPKEYTSVRHMYEYSFEEAKKRAREMGIKSGVEYRKRFIEDDRFPTPIRLFLMSEFKEIGAPGFFRGEKKNPNLYSRKRRKMKSREEYLSFDEWCVEMKKIMKKEGFISENDYMRKKIFLKCKSFHSKPTRFYKEFKGKTWSSVFRKKMNIETYAEMKEIIKEREIENRLEYKKILLPLFFPLNPWEESFWEGDDIVFVKKVYYNNMEDVIESLLKLKIPSLHEYNKKRHLDPKLPVNLKHVFGRDVGSWKNVRDLLKKKKNEKYYYNNMEDVVESLFNLKVSSVKDYNKKRHLDPKLPVNLKHVFGKGEGSWKNVRCLLEKKKNEKYYYNNMDDVIESLLKLEIFSIKDYNKKRHLDPKLPVNLKHVFGYTEGSWKNIRKLLNKKTKQKIIKKKEKKSSELNLILERAKKVAKKEKISLEAAILLLAYLKL